MKIKFKKLHPDAKMPQKAYNDDFCYDVWAVSEEEVAPNVWKYGLGFAIEIVNDRIEDIQCGITLRPRSSIYKTGMVLSNSIGTIDFSYRGEISAVFYHILPNMPRYKIGDKIAQIHMDFSYNMEFEEIDELSQTNRGIGGFGSTGN